MTPEEIKKICLRELLGGEKFLSIYHDDLLELINDINFIQFIEDFCSNVSHNLIFSLNENSQAFKNFKKRDLCEAFFSGKIFNRFPAYQHIYRSVQRHATGSSATISVFYSVFYFMPNLAQILGASR